MAVARIPKTWMPDCKARRIICHWTAGGYLSTAHDRASYHVLIEGSGNHVRGVNIAYNCPIVRGRYAAHTLNANNYAIGVAVCAMAGAKQSPFSAGRYPMTRGQWNALIIACADLCRRYDIPVTPRTVLGHGEVQQTLGIKQRGKWEFVLPWEPEWSVLQTGDELRRRVALAIEEGV